MIQTLVATCYLAFLILAMLSPFLPLFLMWRAASLSLVMFVGAKLLEGPIHWSDKNVGYALGLAIITIFFTVVLVALVVRLALAVLQRKLSFENLSGPDENWRHWIDRLALAGTGVIVGFACAIFLSRLLGGSDLGSVLDLGISLAAVLSALGVVLYSRGKLATVCVSACLGTAAVAVAGSGQSGRIIDQAAMIADGRPWCLSLPPLDMPASKLSELEFFSMKKGSRDTHLVLLIREGDGFKRAHWSIRRQRFFMGVNGNVSSCNPIVEFAKAIRNGEVKDQLIAIGPHLYSLPAEFAPRASFDRLSIRSAMLTGPKGTMPQITERIEVIYDAANLRVPPEAVALEALNTLNINDVSKLTDGKRIVIAGQQNDGQRRVLLNCLHGPYADQNCRAQVIENEVMYIFYLPFANITRWSEATDQVIALFADLRKID